MIGFQQEVNTEVALPMLGMRSDGSGFFQYLLQGLSAGNLRGAIPSWVIQQDRLECGDLVRPNLPFNVDGCFLDQGEVRSVSWDVGEQTQYFELNLKSTDVTGVPVHLFLERGQLFLRGNRGSAELLLRLLKDGFLLKRGIAIYLKHLFPFFSRRGEYPLQDYLLLRAEVLDDVRNRVLKNGQKLEAMHRLLSETGDDPFRDLDLEGLRGCFEPEIQPELFRMTFGSQTVERYLSATLSLNQKALLDYNTITLLYSSQLG